MPAFYLLFDMVVRIARLNLSLFHLRNYCALLRLFLRFSLLSRAGERPSPGPLNSNRLLVLFRKILIRNVLSLASFPSLFVEQDKNADHYCWVRQVVTEREREQERAENRSELLCTAYPWGNLNAGEHRQCHRRSETRKNEASEQQRWAFLTIETRGDAIDASLKNYDPNTRGTNVSLRESTYRCATDRWPEQSQGERNENIMLNPLSIDLRTVQYENLKSAVFNGHFAVLLLFHCSLIANRISKRSQQREEIESRRKIAKVIVKSCQAISRVPRVFVNT